MHVKDSQPEGNSVFLFIKDNEINVYYIASTQKVPEANMRLKM